VSDAPTPRRLLVLVDQYEGEDGGTEGQMATLLRGLPPRYETHIWVLRETEEADTSALVGTVRQLALPGTKDPRWLACVGAVVREIRRGHFDLIHAFMSDTTWLAPLIGKRAGVPVLTSRRDFGYWQTPRKIDLLRRANRRAARIVCNAEAVAARTVSVEWAPPGQVVVIPNGHDPARFDVPAHPTLRDELGVPAGACLIGLLANFRPIKRQVDLVEAVARIGVRHGESHVLFLGEGDEREVRAAAGRLGTEGRVHVRRFGKDVVPALRSLDIGVLCSESEGLSNAIIEYMACGLPVVASDVGGNPELVQEGVTGLLYPAGHVDTLAKHLTRLIRDPEERGALGAAGRARFEAHHVAADMVARTVALHDAVIQEEKGPRPWSGLTGSLLTAADDIDALVPDWTALLYARQFFLHPAWVQTAWRHEDGEALLVAVHDADGSLAGCLPLTRKGSQVRFAGQAFDPDHLDVVAREGQGTSVARVALDALRAAGVRDLDLRHVAEESPLRLMVRHQAAPFGERAATICHALEPRGRGFDEWLAPRFSKSSRQRFRKQRREFFEREGAEVLHYTRPEHAREALERLWRLHVARFVGRETSSFATETQRRFHEDLVQRLAAEGMLSIRILVAEGRDLAAEYAFRHRDVLFAYQGGADPDEGTASPGTVLFHEMLRAEWDSGALREFDLLDGDESYKDPYADRTRNVFDLRVRLGGVVARPRTWAAGAWRLLKDEAKRRLGRD
jgi:glycosyltransferase involved in cell wall biosynthesis/CelD/BcsL family acetyltransferase involved in cellulose biosynthesis